MSQKKDSKYKSITNKIKRISEALDQSNPLDEVVHDAVVDFVAVFEYVAKKKLHLKNRVLIYELNGLTPDNVKHIMNGTLKEKPTIKVSEALNRYKIFFPKSKVTKQAEGMEILIHNRNELVHGIDIKNIQTKDELIAIMSTVFPSLIADAKPVIGIVSTTKIKKEKIYTEKDIQKIYEDILISKINNYEKPLAYLAVSGPSAVSTSSALDATLTADELYPFRTGAGGNLYGFSKERCPRCSGRTFTRKIDNGPFVFSVTRNLSDLYVCSQCNLELTPTEYEMVGKLQMQGKLKSPNPFSW